jgi:hypothetical protein
MRGHILFLVGIIPLIVYILWPTVDYIVLPGWQTVMVPAKSIYTLSALMVFVLVGLIYWQLNKANRKVNRLLTFAHSLLTFLPIYFLVSEAYLYSVFENRAGILMYQFMIWSYLILILSQVLFVANVAWSLTRK